MKNKRTTSPSATPPSALARTKRVTSPRVKTTPTPRPRSTSLVLAKGQVWKVDGSHIEIVDLGKSLAHYRRLANLNQRTGLRRMTSRKTIEEYLREHRAQLIQSN